MTTLQRELADAREQCVRVAHVFEFQEARGKYDPIAAEHARTMKIHLQHLRLLIAELEKRGATKGNQ